MVAIDIEDLAVGHFRSRSALSASTLSRAESRFLQRAMAGHRHDDLHQVDGSLSRNPSPAAPVSQAPYLSGGWLTGGGKGAAIREGTRLPSKSHT